MWRIVGVISDRNGATYKLKRVNGYEIWGVLTRTIDQPLLSVGDVLEDDFSEIPKEYDMHLDVSGYNIKGRIC